MTNALACSPFSEVIERFRRGEPVIMVDDADRENEGDLVVATELLTPEVVSFMMREARGLICISISSECARRLELPLQTTLNNSPFHTPFAVSVDHREVASSGVTAKARTFTMQQLIAPTAVAVDFISPGHVFPLVANEAGVIGRQGQTEGSYDLARIAGFTPSGVICEILDEDGTMMRGERLGAFAVAHDLAVTSVAEVIRYRVQREVLVREVARTERVTRFGRARVCVFEDDVEAKEHLAVIIGDPFGSDEIPLVRVHSECLTGDVFGSRRCDCGPQLDRAMNQIVEAGAGIVLYLRQEGRGIGLSNKLRAYELQDGGHDTVEANLSLGFAPDQRDFAVAAKILGLLGVSHLRLLTNNPRKVEHLEAHGVSVFERVPLICPSDPYSREYLETKRSKLGHIF